MITDEKKFLDYFGDFSNLAECRSQLIDSSYTLNFSIGDTPLLSAEANPCLLFLVEGQIRHLVSLHSDTGSKTRLRTCIRV